MDTKTYTKTKLAINHSYLRGLNTRIVKLITKSATPELEFIKDFKELLSLTDDIKIINLFLFNAEYMQDKIDEDKDELLPMMALKLPYHWCGT